MNYKEIFARESSYSSTESPKTILRMLIVGIEAILKAILEKALCSDREESLKTNQ